MVTISAMAMLAGTIAWAEPVTLRALDGTVSMTGELLDFDGETYALKTMLGEMKIPASNVECLGDDCPVILNVDFRLAGEKVLVEALVPALFDSFSTIAALKMEQPDSDVANVDSYAFVTGTGDAFASVDVPAVDAGTAFLALLDGNAEIVMTRRTVSQTEAEKMITAGLGDPANAANQIVAALDGVAIIVSPDNPVGALSIDEIGRIFAGRITNWSTLGGPNLAIKLYRVDDSVNAAGAFVDVVFAGNGLSFSESAGQFNNNADVVAAVGADPAGVGFVSIAGMGRAHALPVRQTCGYLSEPSLFTVKTGEYPLASNVYFYHSSLRTSKGNPDRAEKINGFLGFVQSPAAQLAVATAGFVDQTIGALPVENQGRRLINSILDSQNDATFRRVQKVIKELAEAERLSATFRFKPGIAQLDARAVGDVKRLVEYLWTTDLSGKEVVLAGFSDAAGTGSQNERLSLKRANQVLTRLQDALGADVANIPFVTLGFGEVAPLGCNDTLEGRSVNRRVEVWIRDAK